MLSALRYTIIAIHIYYNICTPYVYGYRLSEPAQSEAVMCYVKTASRTFGEHECTIPKFKERSNGHDRRCNYYYYLKLIVGMNRQPPLSNIVATQRLHTYTKDFFVLMVYFQKLHTCMYTICNYIYKHHFNTSGDNHRGNSQNQKR